MQSDDALLQDLVKNPPADWEYDAFAPLQPEHGNDALAQGSVNNPPADWQFDAFAPTRPVLENAQVGAAIVRPQTGLSPRLQSMGLYHDGPPIINGVSGQGEWWLQKDINDTVPYEPTATDMTAWDEVCSQLSTKQQTVQTVGSLPQFEPTAIDKAAWEELIASQLPADQQAMQITAPSPQFVLPLRPTPVQAHAVLPAASAVQAPVSAAVAKGKQRKEKIGEYNPSDHYDALPTIDRDWSSTSYRFSYSPNGALSCEPLTVSQLQEFIHDRDITQPLIMRIQKAPADSGRRHLNDTNGGRCICASCPMRGALQSIPNITIGEPRVALDEWEHERRSLNLDPFAVSGYLHLYCVERFLDFPSLVIRGLIELDTRDFPTEPNKRFAALMCGADVPLVQSFIDSLYTTADVRALGYPTQAELAAGEFGKYQGTLTQRIMSRKIDLYKPSTLAKFRGRDHKATQIQVHKGDLEIVRAARMEERNVALSEAQKMMLFEAMQPWVGCGGREMGQAVLGKRSLAVDADAWTMPPPAKRLSR